ncbi:MAG: hypothetical protein IT337_17910 [Thermomicrobiales bacterium]|nr:hypothetical protein [Thermomicrobiales bacterium]
MDEGSFDALSRGIGRHATRRSALAALTGALLGFGSARAVLAQETGAPPPDDTPPDDTPPPGDAPLTGDVGAAGACRGRRDRCNNNRRCCQGLRCNNRRRRCVWRNNHGRREGDWCRRNGDCDRNRNLRCDNGRNRCVHVCGRVGERCRQDRDCCGRSLCDDSRDRCCTVRGDKCTHNTDCCGNLRCRQSICQNP